MHGAFAEKKLLFAVLLLSGLLLAGCQKRETPLQEDESEYQVYYMNQAVTKLIAQPYRTRTTGTEELIGELMESLTHVPADLEAQSVLSDKVVYQGCRQDDTVLYLFFDNNYTSMNACQEILCRAALARTLTQVAGIEYISIYSGDQPLLERSGMPARSHLSRRFRGQHHRCQCLRAHGADVVFYRRERNCTASGKAECHAQCQYFGRACDR